MSLQRNEIVVIDNSSCWNLDLNITESFHLLTISYGVVITWAQFHLLLETSFAYI